MSLWNWLVNPAGLTPHGFCLLWAPGLIWLHALSDIVIGLAYFSIPLALAWFAHRRTDLEYRWVLLLFVAFILACGLTHFMAVYTLWVAAYGVEGLIKATTAVLSVGTALLLWPLIPRLLALPSPADMAALNASLSDKVAEQERTYRLLQSSEEEVRRANAELERRVAERTAALTATNERLRTALEDLEGTRLELEATVRARTEALAQRDLLLREVYHRVKNNLQIIDSVIVLQSAQLPEDEATAAFVQSLRNRIYTLGLVHQQLMGSADLQTFDIAPFIRELAENIVAASAGEDIVLSVEACPLCVTLDYAVPLGLIVTELVTNSLKHAFVTGRGRLDVTVSRNADDGQIVVTVADDGPGTATAPDSKRHTGVGKRIVDGLVKQLDGRMIVDATRGMMTQLFLPQPKVANI